MSECGQKGAAQCDEPTSEFSAISEEGKWVGIGFGFLVFVIVFAWIVKTCKQSDRRQKVLKKLVFCYRKHVPDPESQRQSSVGQSRPSTNGTLPHVYENGMNGKNRQTFTSSSYQDETDTCDFTLEDVLRYGEDEDVNEDDDNGTGDDWKIRNGNNSNMRKFRKRHSRISLHSLSIGLETIEEDLNEAKHTNSDPEIRESNNISDRDRNDNKYHGTKGQRSRSVPAKLSAMMNDSILEEAPAYYDDVFEDNNNNENIIISGIKHENKGDKISCVIVNTYDSVDDLKLNSVNKIDSVDNDKDVIDRNNMQ